MNKAILLLVIFLVFGCKDEDVNPIVYEGNDVTTNPIFINIQEIPFQKGTEAMYRFIYDNLKYPALAKENHIQGQVTYSFIVEPNGTSSNFELKKGIGYGCDEECLKVLKLMHWIPGKKDNKSVRTSFTLPVKFVLQG